MVVLPIFLSNLYTFLFPPCNDVHIAYETSGEEFDLKLPVLVARAELRVITWSNLKRTLFVRAVPLIEVTLHHHLYNAPCSFRDLISTTSLSFWTLSICPSLADTLLSSGLSSPFSSPFTECRNLN
jgi:hypothetical protein